jgi:hypothetical protein
MESYRSDHQPILRRFVHRGSVVILISLFSVCAASAQLRNAFPDFQGVDKRGAPEVTICTQNLENFGTLAEWKERTGNTSDGIYATKISGLVERINRAQCDIIVVQELLGKDKVSTEKGAALLVKKLSEFGGKPFQAVIHRSEGQTAHIGMLYATNLVDVVNQTSYERVELPKLSDSERPRYFARAPFEVQFASKKSGNDTSRLLTVIGIHFKSKSGSENDPTGLQFETVRMQMAEAVRRIVGLRHQRSLEVSDSILVVAGDRNSDPSSASARILEGALSLASFAQKGPCRLGKSATPLCMAGSALPQRLFSVLTRGIRTQHVRGSFSYKGVPEWIDDILIPQVSLHYAQGGAGPLDYDAGVVTTPPDASDHALAYVRLNW